MRFEPVSYMAWAKSHMEDPAVQNLGSSGIRNLLSMDDLAPDLAGLSIWGRNDDGLPELRDRVAERYGVDGANVLLAEGTSLANFLVLAAWIRPGDPVLLEEPFYEPLESVLRAVGARIRRVAVDGPDGYRPLLDLLCRERGTRWRAAVVTNPHNPTGARIPEDLLTALGDACSSMGGILLVDEVYREMLFEEPPGCASRGRSAVVTTASLTKVFGLGPLRIGWAIGPAELIARAIRIHDNLGVVHPHLTESLGARILGDGRFPAWKDRVRLRVEANRAMLNAFLREQPLFEGSLPPQGILAFPRWKGDPRFPDADTLCRCAQSEAKVVLVPGRFYQRHDRLRIAVGGPEDEVRGALDAFGRFLANPQAGRPDSGRT